ncbi:MAG TPA: hypothetical protein VGL38_03680 [bacterium]|jgi:hypothetical protein
MLARLTCVTLLLAGLAFGTSAWALDLTFTPDTSTGDAGQSVWISAQLSASQPMRGFTVYMSYDTNVIDLDEPPVAGALVANRQGLQFNYFDHAAFEPTLLEVGATVFGTDFWQGPGELFRARFTLRRCGAEEIAAPYAPFFVAADGTYPTVTYHPGTVIICPGMPAMPQGLTVYPDSPSSVRLIWSAVTQSAFGQPLPSAPVYRLYRQQVQPSLPVVLIATVPDTAYTDTHSTGIEYIYYVTAQTNP